MSVRAKFKVESVTPNIDGGTIKMIPIVSGSPENESFFKYTPWGAIEIGTINREAFAEFNTSDEFYVDFTKAY